MTRWVALLRGINVGGSWPLPMAELRRICHAAGCSNVATYIQSGNMVLTHETASGTAQENNPFPGVDGTKLVVWFLPTTSDTTRLAQVDISRFAPEQLATVGREVYLSLPDGQARSPLLAALDKVRPRVRFTARNWNTVTKLHALATALP